MRILVPLRDAALACLWGGLSLSAIGDQLFAVALIWIAVGLLGPWAGYLPALGATIVLATALLAGHWADFWEPRSAMIGADLARAVALVLAFLQWSVWGGISAETLVGLTSILSMGQAIFRPALQGMLAPLVGAPERLPAANALLDTTDRIARLLGPGVVAALAAWLPTQHFLSLDAASFLASALALMLIGRLRRLPHLRRAGGRESVAASILRGFRSVAGHRVLRMEMQVSGGLNGAWYAIMFLGVPLALARHGAGGAGLADLGLIISAYGSTNLLGTLLIGGRAMPANPGRMVFAGNLILGLGMLVIAVIAAAPVSASGAVLGFAGGACLGAVGGPMHDIPVAVLRQTELARENVPAAMRASLVVNNAGLLVAMLIVPVAYAMLPLAAVMGVCAAVIIGIGVVGTVRFAGPGAAHADGVVIR